MNIFFGLHSDYDGCGAIVNLSPEVELRDGHRQRTTLQIIATDNRSQIWVQYVSCK
jgi:hypothetical protein